MRPKVEIGQRFGRLVVTAFERRDENRRYFYRCKCDCGTETVKKGTYLLTGETRSCGCLREEARLVNRLTHGASRTGTYRSWSHMKTRCLNTRSAPFPEWGGRGIKICDRWMVFENFLQDMGAKPGPEYSIDRIDNDGNYEPSNCRWATWTQQANNKRANRNATRYTVNGETGTIVELAKRHGIHHNAVYMRLQRGMPVVDAFTKPYERVHKRHQRP